MPRFTTRFFVPLGLSCVPLWLAPSAVAQSPTGQETARQATSGYGNGFFMRSADGRNQLAIEGLMQTNGRFFEAGLPDRDSEFFLRRFRLELVGKLHRVYRFKMEPNFTEDGVHLDEAWIGLQPGDGDFKVILGRMKEPFSLEEMSSLRRMEFVEKSILNQFIPAEDHGITLLGRALDRQLEWGLAYYNGTGGNDLNSDKDGAARLVWHPCGGFQVGVAATYGRADQDISGKELRTETRVPFAEFQKGSRRDGDLMRLGAEAAWFCGPASVKGEYIHIEQDMNTVASGTVSLSGYYISGTWLLTGEPKSFGTVRPKSPVLFDTVDASEASGAGAFEFAWRVSELELDRDLVDLGLVPMAMYPGRVRTFDVGINWYLTPHARMLTHLVYTDYEHRITRAGDTRGSETSLLLQFQLSF